jgi:aldehyde:ferredoxin oxidoreductase
MANGYMSKLLFVDLARGVCQEEALPQELCRDFLGGYGVATRILCERMKPRVEPLGPGNILGFMTGPLTDAPALCCGRYVVVGKSPLMTGLFLAVGGKDVS